MNNQFKASTQIWKVAGVTLLVSGLQLYGQQTSPFTTFDPTGSISTQPQAINQGGAITGYYQDANSVYHGFLRAPRGPLTTFDAPGSGTQQYAGTQAYGINKAGVITGFYIDASSVPHGFLRAPNGRVIPFDPPFSGSTQAYGINTAGTITGVYYDTNSGTNRGFLRAPDGSTFTPFDPPSNGYTTGPYAINDAGAITGIYQDASFVYQGFLRPPDGTFTTVIPPGSTYTQPLGINAAGAITGYYQEFVGQSAPRAFLRDRYGNIIGFDYPNTSQGTFGYAINTAGTITGNYFANNQYHGFVRASNGTFHTFDPPGSKNTTQPSAINRAGEITGYYYDTSGMAHGFLRIPPLLGF
jgi:hypothetical protein